MFDACEEITGWTASGCTLMLDGDDKKEGDYSLKAEGNKAATFMFRKQNIVPPFDTEVTHENGYLAFDLYVSDASLLGNIIRLDLSSHVTQ